jgi:hypothetical protein
LSAWLLPGCAADYNSAWAGNQDMSATPDLGMYTDGAFCSSIVNIVGDPPPAVAGGPLYAPVDLIATAIPNTANLERPDWNVSYADGTLLTPEIIDQASGLSVRVHAPLPGSYTFRVTFPLSDCRGMSSVEVRNLNSKGAVYKLRISPPSTAGVPQQDQTIVVYGGTPNGAHDLTLQAGSLLTATLRGPGGAPAAGEVRFVGDNGPDALASAGMAGAFAVALNNDLIYTPLLIPAASTLAPRLLAKDSGANLAAATFSLDAGQAVSGTVSDPAGAPIAGARVVLRAGKLPSGSGVSASDGSYLLRAQTGSYVAAVGADGWPELAISPVTVPAAAQTMDVKYLVSRVQVAAKVVASSGAAVAGARVTLRSSSLPSLATVTVGGSAQPAGGRVNQVVVSAADGTLPPLLLPAASYDVLVEPPAGAADGVTAQTLLLAGNDTWTLTLQARIVLAGKVTNLLGVGVGDVKVTAFETAGLGAAPSARTTSNGSFSVSIDPGSPLEMLFEPSGSSNLSSVRLALPAGSTQALAALGPGLRVGGYVVGPGGGRLPSVVVEALCGSCGSATPIASAVSDGSGAYALYLPDPGVDVGDGGVDLSP